MAIEEELLPASAGLAELERGLRAGKHGALDEFWRTLGDRETVLLETTGCEDGQALVTFLWRADDVEDVLLAGGIAGWDAPGTPMSRLLDTDLWYKTYRVVHASEIAYVLMAHDSSSARGDASDGAARVELRTYAFPRGRSGRDERGFLRSLAQLPGAPPQPWVARPGGAGGGRVRVHFVRSEILGNGRHVWVYTPPGYTPEGEPPDLMVQLDGETYTDLVSVPTILDELISGGRIPPAVAVLLDNVDHETRMREYGCNPRFVEFLTEELLPWVRERYRVACEPGRTLVSGSSMGGLAAAYAGLLRPDAFGKVLSQSGSYWWKPEGEREHEWLARQFAESPRVPVRFYLEVGVRELATPPENGPTQVVVNRHMRNVLRAKGYDVRYSEFDGDHDWVCWKATLADGLLALNAADRELSGLHPG